MYTKRAIFFPFEIKTSEVLSSVCSLPTNTRKGRKAQFINLRNAKRWGKVRTSMHLCFQTIDGQNSSHYFNLILGHAVLLFYSHILYWHEEKKKKKNGFT